MRERHHDRQRWSELRFYLGEAPSLLAYLAACRSEGLAALAGMADGERRSEAGEYVHALKSVCDGLGLLSMKREIEWASAQWMEASVVQRNGILASLRASFEQDLLALGDWAAKAG